MKLVSGTHEIIGKGEIEDPPGQEPLLRIWQKDRDPPLVRTNSRQRIREPGNVLYTDNRKASKYGVPHFRLLERWTSLSRTQSPSRNQGKGRLGPPSDVYVGDTPVQHPKLVRPS